MSTSPSGPDRELTLADYGRALWRGRGILVTAIVVAAVAGLALTFIRTTTYTGTSQVFLGQATTPSGTPVTTPATNPTIAPTVLEGDDLVLPVAEAEEGLSPGELRSGLMISVPRAPGSAGNLPTLAAISFTHKDAETAQRVTNAFAEQVVAYNTRVFADTANILDTQIADAREDITRLEKVVVDLRASAGSDPAGQTALILAQQELGQARGRQSDAELELAATQELRAPGIVTVAGSPTSSSSGPARVRTTILAALIGAIIGSILALAWSGRGSRVEAA